MAISPALFSSANHEWQTPEWLFDRLNHEFLFDLDAGATETNRMCSNFISPEQDALKTPWTARSAVWVNPPYSRAIVSWVNRAIRFSQPHLPVVMLLPARTDTGWWHEQVLPHAAEIRFIRGRLRFQGAPTSAPFPSVIVVFRGAARGNLDISTIDSRDKELEA